MRQFDRRGDPERRGARAHHADVRRPLHRGLEPGVIGIIHLNPQVHHLGWKVSFNLVIVRDRIAAGDAVLQRCPHIFERMDIFAILRFREGNRLPFRAAFLAPVKSWIFWQTPSEYVGDIEIVAYRNFRVPGFDLDLRVKRSHPRKSCPFEGGERHRRHENENQHSDHRGGEDSNRTQQSLGVRQVGLPQILSRLRLERRYQFRFVFMDRFPLAAEIFRRRRNHATRVRTLRLRIERDFFEPGWLAPVPYEPKQTIANQTGQQQRSARTRGHRQHDPVINQRKTKQTE